MQTNYYLNPTFLPSRQGEIEHSCADITLAQEKLGFQPLISLEEGIKSLL
jgi:nucleoside-diphosphate-sugar epimerase